MLGDHKIVPKFEKNRIIMNTWSNNGFYRQPFGARVVANNFRILLKFKTGLSTVFMKFFAKFMWAYMEVKDIYIKFPTFYLKHITEH